MGQRYVIKTLVSRDDNAMRTVYVGGHFARVQVVVDTGAAGAKAHQRDSVRRFGKDVDQIILVGPGLPEERRHNHENGCEDKKEAGHIKAGRVSWACRVSQVSQAED